MQGDLFEGYPVETWRVVEVRTDPEQFYIDEDGNKHEFVVYCLTEPIGWIDPHPAL